MNELRATGMLNMEQPEFHLRRVCPKCQSSAFKRKREFVDGTKRKKFAGVFYFCEKCKTKFSTPNRVEVMNNEAHIPPYLLKSIAKRHERQAKESVTSSPNP